MVAPLPRPSAPTVVAEAAIADAALAIPTLDLKVAQAKAEAALFGAADAVRIGRYRVLERVGAGGMGVVWSAWDPALGRTVALKLASSGDAAVRARARDEGRALARLSHPNVVPIYDVLDHDDRVLLVMELVAGDNLRVASRTRTPAQIVRDYRQAGEGLAAAHRAGLIHRDFKPDNAILGADGRVRVLDFGLAHDVARGDDVVGGTPGYMPPEQARGEVLTPTVDQYALCVSLRQTLAERGGVPRWLVPTLERGTALAPDARFPSMEALLAELARDPATRWRRRAAVGGGALALAGAAAAFLAGRAQHAGETPCSGGPTTLAPAWPGRRAAIASTLGAFTDGYARDGVPTLLARADRYSDDWLGLHRASCRAHARGELSTALYDRRTACLDRARSALTALGDVASRAGAADVAGLVAAASALPTLDACSDDTALLGAAGPPADLAAEVAAIDVALARVDVERDAGRVDDAARSVAPLVVRADTVAYAPVQARAQLAAGRVAMTAATGDWGVAAFAAATRAAVLAGDDAAAVEAWARQAWSTAMVSERGDGGAREGLPLVEAMATRAGQRGQFARALLHNNLGGVARASGDAAAARQWFEAARRERAGLVGAEAQELLAAIENLLLLVDDADERERLATELISARRAQLGATHPLALQAEALVGTATPELDVARGRLATAVSSLARYHPALGGTIADLAREPALLAAIAGDAAQVRAMVAAVETAAAHGADPHDVALVRGLGQLVDGDAAGAARGFRAALAPLDTAPTAPWWLRTRALNLRLALALCERALGRAPTADLAAAAALADSVAAAMPTAMAARRRQALARLGAR